MNKYTALAIALLTMLVLSGCEQAYACDSPEARSNCAAHLANTVSPSEFVQLRKDCVLVGRYITVEQRDYFTTQCLSVTLGIPVDLFNQCIDNGAGTSYEAGRGSYENRLIGIILCANGLDYTNQRANVYPNR